MLLKVYYPPGPGLTKMLRVVKFTAIILLTTCLHISAKTVSQTVTLSEKNAPLEKVFSEIKKQTGYVFFYSYDALQEAKKITIDIKNADLRDALKLCLKDQPLSFTIENKTVFIVKSLTQVLQSDNTHSLLNFFPPIDIHGKVVNEKGEPVAGVTVLVKGAKNATATDINGDFTITNVDANAVLVFSGTNIETFEQKINGNTSFNLTAKIKVTSMQDVVVNKGYYTEKQMVSVGNVGHVSAKDIESQPLNNPLLALQGRVPGVIVTQTTGLPGSAVTILIRGKGSIQSSTNPLYIIDGVPYDPNTVSTLLSTGESALISINPADIESIEVLKDAEATAIYGSRGANGVILISTKKAKSGKTTLSINVQSGISEVARKADLMNAQQYIQLRKDAFANDNVTPTVATAPDILVWDASKSVDWQDMLFGNTAYFTDAQVSVSGGTPLARILFNTGYHKETTIYAPNDFGMKRFSTHLNADLNSQDMKFNINTSVSFSVNTTDVPISNNASSAFSMPPHFPYLNPDGTPNWNSGIVYPLAFLEASSQSRSHTLIGNSALRYRILPGLEIKTNFGYTRRTSDQQTLTPLKSLNPANGVPSSRFSDNTIESYIIEPQLDYKYNTGKSQFAALVGGTLQQTRTEAQSLNATGFSSDALLSNPAAAGSVIVSSYPSTHYRYNSVFGRLSYNWNKKYIANVTFRRDGSSRFGPGKKFGNFGAVGAGWIFSDESFIKNAIPFLSFGKLRGSYGITGNDQIQDYGYLAAYSSGLGYQGIGSLQPARIVNDEYGWEENRKMEVTAELGFLKDRITLNATYYRNRSSNSLIFAPLPNTSGFASYQANFPALIQNKGWEFLLNTVNITNNDFRWETSFNISFNRNKLVSFPNIQKTAYGTLLAVGSSLYRGRTLHFLGVDSQTGLAQFEDLNGDGVISFFGTSNDLKFRDDDMNNYYGGLENNISYKNFRLDFLFEFVKRVANNSPVNNVVPGTLNNNQNALLLDYWKKPGDITNTPRPSTTAGSPGYTSYSNWLLSDALYGDASYIKLKNVSLTYNVSTEKLKKFKLNKLEIFARTQNVFSITAYKVIDPETGNILVPPSRVITAGINCQF